MRDFYEFFAGGGMARAGLGTAWRCLFANDFDPKKGGVYRDNWGGDGLVVGDVGALTSGALPGRADLAWASFPCQDLSLAGGGAGLKGERSGTFWPFWKLVAGLAAEGRAPRMVVLENVCGALTSHDGQDLAAICGALQRASYRYGVLIVDAAAFVPQSRPRLFVVAVRHDVAIPNHLIGDEPSSPFHTRALLTAHAKLPAKMRKNWIWWRMAEPPVRNVSFADLIDDKPTGVAWHSREETKRLLAMMSEVNRAKVAVAKKAGRRMVGGVYKRTRLDATGKKAQRAEVRFDLSGCLRTPAGGSSRQLILVVDGASVKSRLISSRETARLMGLPEEYRLPDKYNDAYHLTGDGVVVPVVRYLAEQICEPILDYDAGLTKAAA